MFIQSRSCSSSNSPHERRCGRSFHKQSKYAYDNLPEYLKVSVKASVASTRKFVFSNGSSFTVGTGRSGTFQKLLVSEYGKISAKYPEKAREIKTGALNTVEAGQQIFIESTAEGKTGYFFELCELARKLKDQGRQLTRLNPKFHFYAWFDNPAYTLSDEEAALTPIPQELNDYFAQLPQNIQEKLTWNQKAWYAAKWSIQGNDMRREYPSTPQEAFEGSLEGAFYTREMEALRRAGRIRRVPKNPDYPVYTAWDLGLNDLMTIWFFQYIDGELYFIDYHESSFQTWEYYAKLLAKKDHVYEMHLFPHDGNKRVRLGDEIATDKQLAEKQGIRPIKIVPRTASVDNDIRNYCKTTLPLCYFDEENCGTGLNHLDNYRKVWSAKDSMFMSEPLHDEASHGADGYRTAAMAFKRGILEVKIREVQNKSAGLRTTARFEKIKPTNPTRRLRARR